MILGTEFSLSPLPPFSLYFPPSLSFQNTALPCAISMVLYSPPHRNDEVNWPWTKTSATLGQNASFLLYVDFLSCV